MEVTLAKLKVSGIVGPVGLIKWIEFPFTLGTPSLMHCSCKGGARMSQSRGIHFIDTNNRKLGMSPLSRGIFIIVSGAAEWV